MRRPTVTRPSAVRPYVGDGLLALVLTGLTLVTLAAEQTDVSALDVALAVCTVAPLAVRQLVPVGSTAVILAAVLASGLAEDGVLPSAGIGILIAVFTVAMLCDRVTGAAVCVAAVGVIVVVSLAPTEPLVWSQVAQGALIVLVAYVLGRTTRRWSERLEGEAARTASAVAGERVRIARELHDVVAHHMSLISLQASVAEYVADSDPAAARRSMAVVHETGREALVELRRLLAVLRPDDETTDGLSPQPGLADLDALAERVGSSGVEVRTVSTGDAVTLAPGADLCAYRVIQEALTNVLRHSGADRADVRLDWEPGWFTAVVSDDGRRSARRGRSPGYGIRGMQERARLYGGTLQAGPHEAGGFRVTLRLPLRVEPAT